MKTEFKIDLTHSVRVVRGDDQNITLSIEGETLHLDPELNLLNQRIRDEGYSPLVAEIIDVEVRRVITTNLVMEILKNHIKPV